MQNEKLIEERSDDIQSKQGKFNTADDLLEAYNALEKEFTKRCQLVKQLQAELDALRAQDSSESDGIAINTSAEEKPSDDREPESSLAAIDNFESESVKDRSAEIAASEIAGKAESVVNEMPDSGGNAVSTPNTEHRCVCAQSGNVRCGVLPADPSPNDLQEAACITESAVLEEVAKNACEYAQKLCAVPEIMDACIALYKQRLMGIKSLGIGAGSPSGMAVIVPAKRPKTLSEAKALADAMLV